jgi:hypothetical protein
MLRRGSQPVRHIPSVDKSGNRPRDLRLEMIAETSALLTWALARDRGLPRIPTRRMDQGGFARLMGQRPARALVERWWSNVLDLSASLFR